jgi:hypothetical protein
MYARIASSSGIRSLPVSTLRSAFQVQPKSAEQPPVVTLTSEEFNDAFTNNRSDITI